MEYEKELDQVAERIRLFRTQKGISQLELANKASFSQSFLANLESGKKRPSVLTILRIAGALGVNPRDFFPDSNEPDKGKVKEKIRSLLDSI